jgi:hypothetical protein
VVYHCWISFWTTTLQIKSNCLSKIFVGRVSERRHDRHGCQTHKLTGGVEHEFMTLDIKIELSHLQIVCVNSSRLTYTSLGKIVHNMMVIFYQHN